MAPVKFGYWKLRGLGQTVKLLMEYTGTDYEEKVYDFGPAPDFAQCQWLHDKFSMGMPFPNLPYYIDGTYKITQSHAILKHIARKNNLVGKSECENVRIDMAEHEAQDLRLAWIKLVYNTKEYFESNKEEYRTKTLKTKLENLSKFLCSNSWFAGETLTYVDFLLYELFDIHRTLFHCCLNEFDNLQKFMTRFESLGPIKKYMSSCKFMKTPLNGPMAAYVGN